MDHYVAVITILAMCFGYSLIKLLITSRNGKRARENGCEERTFSLESQDQLSTRAEELLKRIRNLEEIMSSEKDERS